MRLCSRNLDIMAKDKRARILLVDDSPEMLQQEKTLLEKTGVELETEVIIVGER